MWRLEDGPEGLDGQGRLLLSYGLQVIPVSMRGWRVPETSDLMKSVGFVPHDCQELQENTLKDSLENASRLGKKLGEPGGFGSH